MSKKVIIFGDSIMFGSGNYGVGVGEFLQKKFGFGLKKYCIGGARVGYVWGKSWVVEQAREIIKAENGADYIIFDGFTNDCCKNGEGRCDVPLGDYDPSRAAKNIVDITKTDDFSTCFQSVVAAMKEKFPSAEILFVRPHKMGRRDAVAQKEYGERAVQICKRYGVKVADMYEETNLDTFRPEHRDKYTFDSYDWGKGDATHPNDLCYREIYMPLIEKKLGL